MRITMPGRVGMMEGRVVDLGLRRTGPIGVRRSPYTRVYQW